MHYAIRNSCTPPNIQNVATATPLAIPKLLQLETPLLGVAVKC